MTVKNYTFVRDNFREVINKVKRELGFVLIALNIRKVVAQRANYNQNNNEKGNFY